MKESRPISSGSRVNKQQNYEEFIRNFHKKLKIGDGPHESNATPANVTVTALIPYKKSIETSISNALKNFDTTPNFQNVPFIIPRNHLKIEQMFHEKEIVKRDFEIDEKEDKMILD
jgi:hypothetical protein